MNILHIHTKLLVLFYSTCVDGHITCTEITCQVDCQISDYEPQSCSASCGSGMIVGKAYVIQEPLYGGAECPPLYIDMEPCYAGACGKESNVSLLLQLLQIQLLTWSYFITTECPENETYVNQSSYESSCSSLGQWSSTPVWSGASEQSNAASCQCSDDYYRNQLGQCVVLDECGCVLENGTLVPSGFQWQSSKDECIICECLLGSSEPVCSPKCNLPITDDNEHLDFSNDSCCPSVVPGRGMCT